MSVFDLDRPTWMADANCRGVDVGLFFLDQGSTNDAEKARSICRSCDVQAECLAYALSIGEAHGIWGGLTPRQRVRLRRARRRDLGLNMTGPIARAQ